MNMQPATEVFLRKQMHLYRGRSRYLPALKPCDNHRSQLQTSESHTSDADAKRALPRHDAL